MLNQWTATFGGAAAGAETLGLGLADLGEAVQPMLVAIRRAIRWVTAARRAQGRVRAVRVRVHGALHGHRPTMRLPGTSNAARIG